MFLAELRLDVYIVFVQIYDVVPSMSAVKTGKK